VSTEAASESAVEVFPPALSPSIVAVPVTVAGIEAGFVLRATVCAGVTGADGGV